MSEISFQDEVGQMTKTAESRHERARHKDSFREISSLFRPEFKCLVTQGIFGKMAGF